MEEAVCIAIRMEISSRDVFKIQRLQKFKTQSVQNKSMKDWNPNSS